MLLLHSLSTSYICVFNSFPMDRDNDGTNGNNAVFYTGQYMVILPYCITIL